MTPTRFGLVMEALDELYRPAAAVGKKIAQLQRELLESAPPEKVPELRAELHGMQQVRQIVKTIAESEEAESVRRAQVAAFDQRKAVLRAQGFARR